MRRNAQDDMPRNASYMGRAARAARSPRDAASTTWRTSEAAHPGGKKVARRSVGGRHRAGCRREGIDLAGPAKVWLQPDTGSAVSQSEPGGDIVPMQKYGIPRKLLRDLEAIS